MPQTLNDVAWPVRTRRLLIRPVVAADADATWRIRCIPGVSEWLIGDPGDLQTYAAGFLDGDRLARTLIVEQGGQVIGDLTVAIGDGWAQKEVAEQAIGVQAELGWVMDPRSGGQGLATEAVVAVLDICFGALGLRRVTADCFADNTGSWRLMERVGMRREAQTVRDSLHRSGRWLNGLSYAMLADEWPAIRARVIR